MRCEIYLLGGGGVRWGDSRPTMNVPVPGKREPNELTVGPAAIGLFDGL